MVGAISDHAAETDLIRRDPVNSQGWKRLNEWLTDALTGLAGSFPVAGR